VVCERPQEEPAQQLERFQSHFHWKFAGPVPQDLITKHMPKSREQPDLADILKHKHSRHQTAHKAVVQ